MSPLQVAKLSEGSLLHNLRVRYSRDDIYTRAGTILISVNPFKPLSIYGHERMKQAKVRAEREPPRHTTAFLRFSLSGSGRRLSCLLAPCA